jgi:hypothetical protein
MKKILNKHIHLSLMICLTAICILFASCKTDEIGSGSPVITGVRNYATTPGDSVVKSLIPGQWVVLTGQNLKNATQITFDGVPGTFNGALFSETYAIVQVPSVIPFPLVSADKLNTIQFVTSEGSTIYTFAIVPGPPALATISNENPVENDSVYVYGTNLFQLSELNFGGATITNYKTKSDGTVLSFKMPNATTSGPLKITTPSGAITTPYNVNDVTTNSLGNFDNVSTLSWGTGTSNSSTDFPGNHGYYAVLNNGILNAGDGSWWNWERSINLNSGQWVPTADLAAGQVADYAVKFEMNVPGEWNGTTIRVTMNWDFYAKFEPWKNGTQTFSVNTGGKWKTVTIPFSAFLKDDKQAASLIELLGKEGKGEIHIHTISGDKPTATGFRGAIDNIRVVKIK